MLSRSSSLYTFFTSASLSFFRTGLFLTSPEACWDLDPADSLPEPERLSESEVLLDSECRERALSLPRSLPRSLPCSLSDWLPDSDAEWLDSSDAELLQHQDKKGWMWGRGGFTSHFPQLVD